MIRFAIPFLIVFSLVLSPAATQSLKVTFTDITAQAGITFKHVASPEKKYIVESMSGGVAMFDYDNDGDLDLFLVNSLTVDLVKTKGKTKSQLYRNDGGGKFTEVAEKAGVSDVGWGMGVAVGDYNNDGFDDIYVTCLGPDHLFKNNGNGTFTDVTDKAGVSDPRWSTGASFLDYDHDGNLDLFVSNYVDFDINHLPEFGQGQTCTYKSIPVQCGPRGLKGAGDSLFHNNGDGTFTEVSKKAGVSDPEGFYGLGVLTGDFDGDGWVDIFVANDSTPNFHYRNNGDGTFKEIGFTAGTAVNENGSEQGSMGVTAGDYDHDGRLDIFITNFADEYNTLYHNDAPNSFTDVAYAAKVAAVSLPHVGWGTKFFDYDNDGWVDLLVVNGHVYPQLPNYRQPRLFHRNNRDGTFTDITSQFGSVFTELHASRGVAFGDIDNDGDVDLLITDLDGPPQLLRNDNGNANNSILIKTVGVKSNRDGIGARVKVVAGDLTQIDEVRSGDSYISQSDMRLHFGLEKRTKIDLIEVRWPSGTVDRITNAGINRTLTIKEGQGKVDEKEFTKSSS
ncbi:MAG TPA: CRTAC1 family protein [Pyrinomonadaceae bacterium]|nr:CRTAC1 family protein [Pyrinomonadaceae bacterium]